MLLHRQTRDWQSILDKANSCLKYADSVPLHSHALACPYLPAVSIMIGTAGSVISRHDIVHAWYWSIRTACNLSYDDVIIVMTHHSRLPSPFTCCVRRHNERHALAHLWKGRALKGQGSLVRAHTYAAVALLMDTSLRDSKPVLSTFPGVTAATYVQAQHEIQAASGSAFDEVCHHHDYQLVQLHASRAHANRRCAQS